MAALTIAAISMPATRRHKAEIKTTNTRCCCMQNVKAVPFFCRQRHSLRQSDVPCQALPRHQPRQSPHANDDHRLLAFFSLAANLWLPAAIASKTPDLPKEVRHHRSDRPLAQQPRPASGRQPIAADTRIQHRRFDPGIAADDQQQHQHHQCQRLSN